MAKTYINPRGSHVAPGIYTNEIEVQSSVKSLGITSLGLVGETVKGPAFEPINVKNWNEFKSVFGGTNPELFKGSQYPKYEAPYIAKSYLEESENLNVVRVLGLSGYNAGPAWVITASDANGNNATAVAVLRSRGYYQKYYKTETGNCDCIGNAYDVQRFRVGEDKNIADSCYRKSYVNALSIQSYTSLNSTTTCTKGSSASSYSPGTADLSLSLSNLGRFTISGYQNSDSADTFQYAVSLNPADKDYILKVLGVSQTDGDAPIYVESLYDVALEQAIKDGDVTKIVSGAPVFYDVFYPADWCLFEPVNGIMDMTDTSLKRSNVGERYLVDAKAKDKNIKVVFFNYETNAPVNTKSYSAATSVLSDSDIGSIFTVKQYTFEDNKRHYMYAKYSASTLPSGDAEIKGDDGVNLSGSLKTFSTVSASTKAEDRGSVLVFNNADGFYYKKVDNDVSAITLDMNDYKSPYRYASTPWIVSNLKGDANHIEMTRLFRLHTISDGDAANYMIKASIENIRPDDGTFDVVIRDINDTDEYTQPLERFGKCNLVPGDPNYIAYKIGSFDGQYESKSKFVTVEVNETTATKLSVPAGFLGYPVPQFSGGVTISGTSSGVKFPKIKYNTTYDTEIKNRRQYFGLSSWVGVDIDNFTFKGVMAYIESPNNTTEGFHLDSRLSYTGAVKTVDGVSGYTFAYVSPNERTQLLDGDPIIASEAEMAGSIYEYVNLRKFTVYFYGGFDGWDVYRDQRTTSNDYKVNQYRGKVSKRSGEGYSFNIIKNPDLIDLNQNGITSDWYAYLSAVRKFANPDNIDINVLAVPGVDPINTSLLAEEVIDMVEEERGDTLYVMGLPDKPEGAGDYVSSMYTPDEIAALLEDSEVTSNYAAVYYPWVKILDAENGQYINVSPTKDVVRNLALTDNIAFSWYAPAGYSRGNVDCVKAKKNLVLAEEDILYANGINPIKTFGTDGVKIFGQKTLSADKDSLLSRIAVRRLLLRVKKLIKNASIGLIFDPYDSTTKQSFISAVAPILDGVKSNRGLVDYRIEVDDSIENRMRYELPCRIFLKPTSTLEYISISFILTPQNVNFEDIM